MALGVTSCVSQFQTSGTSHTTATLDTTGAKCLLIYIKYDNANPTSVSLSDNKGNTGGNAVIIQSIDDFATQRNIAYYWPITTAGAGHTVTLSWTNNAASSTLFGAITASGTIALDQSANWITDTGVPYDAPSITTTVANSVALGIHSAGLGTTDTTIAAGNGYTIWQHIEGSDLQQVLLYKILSATGATNSQISATDFTGNSRICSANFYEVAAAATANFWHAPTRMGP